ncbi:NUDIX domain-containing protein [Microbacterium pseudoresistens]|uniref:NUDIX domain-containing protein n=1 Tax=Microbacterium pseudoresistens TaxID=640634 RepID=UPI0015CA2F27|nr:NUDIX domain-containing protein [Microbacterium pseudoresistens]
MASVWIHNDDSILLLLRRGSRVIEDSYVGIGGHLEPDEFADPRRGAIRELTEEVGLTEDDLVDLHLRYVAMRDTGNELRIVYYFSTRLRDTTPPPTACTEGELHWFEYSTSFETLPMPVTARLALMGWLDGGPEFDRIHFISVDRDGATAVHI